MSLDKLNKIDEYLSTSVDELIISPLTVTSINKKFVEKYNELVTKFGSTKLNFFFKSERENKVFKKFLYSDICPSCNQSFEKEITNSKLKSGFDFKCLVCIGIENEAKRLRDDIYFNKIINEREIERVNKTKSYIDNYLNPSKYFKEDIPLHKKWGEICYDDYFYNSNDIVEHIKNMNYKSFLETPYWKTVSYKRKAQCEFKCQLCNSNKNLETHHPTYDIKGKEVFNMKKLTVLCHACHEKHHK
jgi:hypothetical protein